MAEQNGRRREFHTKQLAQLEEKLAAVEADLEAAPTESKRLPLEKEAEQLLTKIDQVEAKLAQCDASASEQGVRDRNFEKALQKIDFIQAKEIAALIRQQLTQDGGAVLFFLQRTRMQMGHFCVAEVLNVILGDQIIDGQVVGAYRKYSIDLNSAISQLNETEFLIRLGSYLNLDAQGDAKTLARQIRETIRNSIDSGTTIFLEIKSLDDLLEQQDFLAWFIDDFWKPLIDEVAAVSQEFKSKFIVALIADSQILPDCSDPDYPIAYFCAEAAFDCYKMMSLPLPNWSVEDIQDWLMRFRPLFPKLQHETKDNLKRMAKRVHRMSGDGIPQNVCANLQELLR
ncbi:MAG: hypothetical protein EA342_18370 [Leptolyngbya sp. LCM1.Bin17]|nr:MAG: hypothetical protein EA342_18370 [Leptolyngbya sp. LCM1.Bin17]